MGKRRSFENCWKKEVCKSCTGERCEWFKEMMYLMENCGLPVAKQDSIKLTPEECDYDIFCELNDIGSRMDEFVYEGKNLFLCSNQVGNGKTSWAIKLMHKYFALIAEHNCYMPRALFVSVPLLLVELKDFENPVSREFRKRLKEIDLVVWDDIADAVITPYDYLQLRAYIDWRVLAKKSNIFTSNCADKKDLIKILGDKLTSRVYDISKVVEFRGKGKRVYTEE